MRIPDIGLANGNTRRFIGSVAFPSAKTAGDFTKFQGNERIESCGPTGLIHSSSGCKQGPCEAITGGA